MTMKRKRVKRKKFHFVKSNTVCIWVCFCVYNFTGFSSSTRRIFVFLLLSECQIVDYTGPVRRLVPVSSVINNWLWPLRWNISIASATTSKFWIFSFKYFLYYSLRQPVVWFLVTSQRCCMLGCLKNWYYYSEITPWKIVAFYSGFHG